MEDSEETTENVDAAVLKKYKRIKDDSLKLSSNSKIKSKIFQAKFQKRLKSHIDTSVQLAKEEPYKTQKEGGIQVEKLYERTFDLRQEDIIQSADVGTLKHLYELDLPNGPYFVNISLSGQHAALGGRTGQLSLFDLKSAQLLYDINVNEKIRCIQMCHTHAFLAVAQEKTTNIYDGQGTEVHCLRDVPHTVALDYLPYHYVLVEASDTGILAYRDVSTGEVVAKHATKKGSLKVLTHNEYNAVTYCGHEDGTVTLRCPKEKDAIVSMFSHRGKVTAVQPFKDWYCFTAGADNRWKVWDTRTYREVCNNGVVGAPATCVSVSQTGLIAFSSGSRVEVYRNPEIIPEKIHGVSVSKTELNEVKDEKPPRVEEESSSVYRNRHPYLVHRLHAKSISSLAFRPWEDVLHIGHETGLSTMLVPGSAVANLDTNAIAGPYLTREERRNKEVVNLLYKLPVDSIMLDPGMFGSALSTAVKHQL